MTDELIKPSNYRVLRTWPVPIIVAGMFLLYYLPRLVEDGPSMMWMFTAFGPLLCSLLLLFWWLSASRATWKERVVGLVGLVVLILMTVALVHPSMRGAALVSITLPSGLGAFGLATMVFRQKLAFKRTLIALAAGAAGLLFSTTLRSHGLWGNFSTEFSWRWEETSEEKVVAIQKDLPQVDVDDPLFAGLDAPEWPGFRGTHRDSVQTGTSLSTDWVANPPKLLWQKSVGPGWSSIVVAGNLLFTQEQRGDDEMVVCYNAATGEEVWRQAVNSRFDDPLGGPGPRATPTLADGTLYTMGAQGWLLRLDPKSGSVVWKRDLRKTAEREPPMWGFSSSPLVTNGLVIVFGAGKGNKGLLAFDVASGDLIWSAPVGEQSYSSPHLVDIVGQRLVGITSDSGIDLFDPESGRLKLKHEWNHKGYRALQPIVASEDSLIIPTGLGSGTRRIRVSISGDMLTSEETWTTRKLKPDYSDCVLYEGHLYGFDGSIFTCIDAQTGDRKWKDGRYGKGQVLLLKDAGKLLVTEERGAVVLLEATPEKHIEFGRIQAIEGKTWNHPVVVGDRLYIRNANQIAAYRLTLAGEKAAHIP